MLNVYNYISRIQVLFCYGLNEENIDECPAFVLQHAVVHDEYMGVYSKSNLTCGGYPVYIRGTKTQEAYIYHSDGSAKSGRNWGLSSAYCCGDDLIKDCQRDGEFVIRSIFDAARPYQVDMWEEKVNGVFGVYSQIGAVCIDNRDAKVIFTARVKPSSCGCQEEEAYILDSKTIVRSDLDLELTVTAQCYFPPANLKCWNVYHDLPLQVSLTRKSVIACGGNPSQNGSLREFVLETRVMLGDHSVHIECRTQFDGDMYTYFLPIRRQCDDSSVLGQADNVTTQEPEEVCDDSQWKFAVGILAMSAVFELIIIGFCSYQHHLYINRLMTSIFRQHEEIQRAKKGLRGLDSRSSLSDNTTRRN